MSDELTTNQEVQPDETSQVSEQIEPVAEVEPQEAEVMEQMPTEEEPSETTPKPTRAEKRLHQLLEKNKAPERDYYQDYLNQMPDVTPSDDGSITPEQLQQMVAKETAKNVALAREMDNYRASVTEFTSEVESVGEQLEKDFAGNPKLAEKLNGMLTDMIEKANVRYDTQGRQVLVPSIKPGQLYSQLKEALQLAQGQGTTEATAHLAQQIAEGAVTPSSRQEDTGRTDYTEADIWKNPGAVRAAMRSKLKVAED